MRRTPARETLEAHLWWLRTMAGILSISRIRFIYEFMNYSIYLDSPKWEWSATAVSAPATVCTAE